MHMAMECWLKTRRGSWQLTKPCQESQPAGTCCTPPAPGHPYMFMYLPAYIVCTGELLPSPGPGPAHLVTRLLQLGREPLLSLLVDPLRAAAPPGDAVVECAGVVQVLAGQEGGSVLSHSYCHCQDQDSTLRDSRWEC